MSEPHAAPRRLRWGADPDRRAEQVPLRVVQPGERSLGARRRRARLLAGAALSIFAGMVFGLVIVHVVLAQNQLRLDRLNSQAATAEVRYERLRLEVAQLSAPARIVAEASRRGMVQPPGTTYLVPPTPGAPAGTTRTGGSTAGAGATSSNWTEVKPELAARP